MLNTINIVFTGVGGQGILMASDIVAMTAMMAGFDIKKSEIHGMSQRGGSVLSHVRFGSKIYSPVVAESSANFLISFELLETLRWIEFTGSGTQVIVLVNKIKPETVQNYPVGIEEKIKKTFRYLNFIEPGKTSALFTNSKLYNMLPLGVLSTYLEIPYKYWKNAIYSRSPEKYYKDNVAVFNAGRAFVLDRRETPPVLEDDMITCQRQEDIANSYGKKGRYGNWN